MRILFCGDVCGRAGREVIEEYFHLIKEDFKIDFTILNGENSAHGFGITPKIADRFFSLGIDVITLGNHSFDKTEIKNYMLEKPIIHPLNYSKKDYIKGYSISDIGGYKIMVINLLGKALTFSKIEYKNPFSVIDKFLENNRLKEKVDIIIIDFHAETTSEKNALGFFLDGRVSALLGTHTHIPTRDSRILPRGTAYQSDIGMCGDYDSIIGMEKDDIIKHFLDSNHKRILRPAEKKGTLCASVLDIDESTGLCRDIKPIMYGKSL